MALFVTPPKPPYRLNEKSLVARSGLLALFPFIGGEKVIKPLGLRRPLATNSLRVPSYRKAVGAFGLDDKAGNADSLGPIIFGTVDPPFTFVCRCIMDAAGDDFAGFLFNRVTSNHAGILIRSDDRLTAQDISGGTTWQFSGGPIIPTGEFLVLAAQYIANNNIRIYMVSSAGLTATTITGSYTVSPVNLSALHIGRDAGFTNRVVRGPIFDAMILQGKQLADDFFEHLYDPSSAWEAYHTDRRRYFKTSLVGEAIGTIQASVTLLGLSQTVGEAWSDGTYFTDGTGFAANTEGDGTIVATVTFAGVSGFIGAIASQVTFSGVGASQAETVGTIVATVNFSGRGTTPAGTPVEAAGRSTTLAMGLGL